MNLAFPNPERPVFEWTSRPRDSGIKASIDSPRHRMLIPIHRHQKDLVQRMVNVLQPGTYIQPHLHPRNGATETILVMEGELGFITFDQSGGVKTTHRIPVGGLVDIEKRVWHGVLDLEPNTIIFETKRGPYDNGDKEFSGWAPRETDPEAVPYRKRLGALFS